MFLHYKSNNLNLVIRAASPKRDKKNLSIATILITILTIAIMTIAELSQIVRRSCNSAPENNWSTISCRCKSYKELLLMRDHWQLWRNWMIRINMRIKFCTIMATTIVMTWLTKTFLKYPTNIKNNST